MRFKNNKAVLIIISLAICLISIYIILSFMARPRFHEDLQCPRTLRHIVPILLSYSDEHDGKLPASLDELAKYNQAKDIIKQNIEWSHYVYYPGHSISDSGTAVIMRCVGPHKNGTIHYLFTDGLVKERRDGSMHDSRTTD